jgi:uncharacterized repeat protein (TIGR03803 family)
MKQLGHIATACVGAALLVRCGGLYAPGVSYPLSSSRSSASGYQVLYNFRGAPDGISPTAGLINVNGTLYGTTCEGGAYISGSGIGLGTVFSITTTGTEKVLYSFGEGGPFDGANPCAGLVALDGTLYGTTYYGGAYTGTGSGLGTVFSITTAGTESVLYSFDGADGQWPAAGLIVRGSKLYGTTSYGGPYNNCLEYHYGCGTVFSITLAGKQRLLHSFGNGSDARIPQAGLISVRGALYGTTTDGGKTDDGTIFKIDSRTGEETVLFTFKGGSDGEHPLRGSLILVNGVLYGTTSHGGMAGPKQKSCGTIFSVTTSGTEHIIYRFKGGNDGAVPWNGLFAMGGKLYGTTRRGGNAGCFRHLGCGTVFSVTPSGKERVLHVFTGGSDGEAPTSNLTEVNGVLYGTTSGAGLGEGGDFGTVFSLTP